MPINRILTDADREEFKNRIDDMFKLCPDEMSRKIPEANVQQAFVLSQVIKAYNDGKFFTLSVGCFEDTVYAYLKAKEASVVGIDPAINFDLRTYTEKTNKRFGVIFATSVIEHVENDERFIADMCTLLEKGGVGILTTDFKDDYKVGDPLPNTDIRFYTRRDLEVRLPKILKKHECGLVDEPDWSGKDNFVYQGHHYSFATFVFRKNSDV